MAHVVYTYTVVGRGTFPADMLRYDRAWPVDTASANAITEDGRRRHVSLHSLDHPTEGRWNSFEWFIEGEVSKIPTR